MKDDIMLCLKHLDYCKIVNSALNDLLIFFGSVAFIIFDKPYFTHFNTGKYFFFVCITSVVLSFYTTSKALRYQVAALNNEDDIERLEYYDTLARKFDRVNDLANFVARTAFFLGLILIS